MIGIYLSLFAMVGTAMCVGIYSQQGRYWTLLFFAVLVALNTIITINRFAELHTQFETAIAECEAELPRNQTCETKVIATPQLPE